MKSRTQQDFAKKFVGIVSVKTGENVVQFTSLDVNKKDGKKKLFPNETDTLKVKLADLPKEAKRVIKPNDKSNKQFRIRLNEDGDAVEAVTPVSGLFQMKLVELGPHKKDAPPVPYVQTYNKGQKDENSHLEFWASYEIVDGVFKGVVLPAYKLHYKFEASKEEDGMTQFDTVDTPKASRLHDLQNWADVHGNILESPIAWNPDDAEGVDNTVLEVYADNHSCEFANILPELQERALEADRTVNGVIENGYISSLQAIIDYEDFSDESDVTDKEIDEKFPEPEKEKVVSKPAGTKSATKKLVKKSSSDEDDL